MRIGWKSAGASTVGAEIDHTTSGGFTAVASNGDLDRDGERILPGCFSPLPASIPVHLDHTGRAADVVARARPYYRGDALMVDATFSSSPEAQAVRAKVADGTLDSLSIVFLGQQWREIDGVRTCVKGELLAADIVSVPSNRGALILSARSYRGAGPRERARHEIADALLMLADIELAEAKSLLRQSRGPARQAVDQVLAAALDPQPTTTTVRRFLRSL